MPYDAEQRAIPCPICGAKANIRGGALSDNLVHCLRCGDFVATLELRDDWPAHGSKYPKKVALASYIIRQLQTKTRPPKIDLATLEEYLNARELLPPPEVTSNLLLLIGDSIRDEPSKMFRDDPLAIVARIGALKEEDVLYHGEALLNLELASGESIGGSFKLRLTHSGWQRYEELRHTRIDTKVAFLARKFENTELDRAIETHFQEAVAQTGFKLQAVTQKAGLIDAIIENEIRNCKFLVVDLSDNNDGAYWEAGFAEGLGKSVIYICKDGVKSHFDTEHRHIIEWHPDKLDEAAQRLKAVIRNTLLGEAIQED